MKVSAVLIALLIALAREASGQQENDNATNSTTTPPLTSPPTSSPVVTTPTPSTSTPVVTTTPPTQAPPTNPPTQPPQPTSPQTNPPNTNPPATNPPTTKPVVTTASPSTNAPSPPSPSTPLTTSPSATNTPSDSSTPSPSATNDGGSTTTPASTDGLPEVSNLPTKISPTITTPSSEPTLLEVPSPSFTHTPGTTTPSVNTSSSTGAPNSSIYITIGSIGALVVLSAVFVFAFVHRKNKEQKMLDQDGIVMLHNATMSQDKRNSRITSDAALMSLSMHRTLAMTPGNPSTSFSNSVALDIHDRSIHETSQSNISLFPPSTEASLVIPPSTRSFGVFEEQIGGSYESRSPMGSQLSPGWESANDETSNSYGSPTDFSYHSSLGSSAESAKSLGNY